MIDGCDELPTWSFEICEIIGWIKRLSFGKASLLILDL
jgi:hypothetical protein